MTWAFKRQFIYLSILIVFFLGLGFLLAYPYINSRPTCSDGKQNGVETGVDCGGSCVRACNFEVDKLSVIWARSFRVADGRHNAVAYVENQNINTAIYKIKYRFRFADKDNLYIGMREGETFVPPSGKFAIFEPAIGVGNSIPVYTTFEFTEIPVWVNVPREELEKIKVVVSDIRLEDESTSPRLSATLRNNSLYNIPEVNVVALLYDVEGNAISASRTFIDMLRSEEITQLSFTWPEPFMKPVVVREIIPMYNFFLAKI
jgi:hypothetical protein